MGKNANGEGSIYQLSNGRWQAAIVIGHNDQGRPIRKTRTCKSKALARAALVELRELHRRGPLPTALTVREWRDLWIADCESRLAPNSVQSYDLLTRNHILPRLGDYRLAEVSPLDAMQLVTSLRAAGVGTSTIRHAIKATKVMFAAARTLRLVSENPFSELKLPAHRAEEIKPFTVTEAQQIITAGEQGRYPGLWKLAFQTGMRIGEMTGLHWTEVDFQSREVRVKQQLLYGRYRGLSDPKSFSGKRTIIVSDDVLQALNEQRKRNLREGHGDSPYVFTAPQGGPVWVSSFYKSHWNTLLRSLNIDHRGIHHIRHTYATLALSQGVPITTVAQILGHSNPSITLRVYAHAIQQEQSQSLAAMQRLFG